MYLMDLQCVQILTQESLFIPMNISNWKVPVYQMYIQYLLNTEKCQKFQNSENGNKQNDRFQILVKATETIPIIHKQRIISI